MNRLPLTAIIAVCFTLLPLAAGCDSPPGDGGGGYGATAVVAAEEVPQAPRQQGAPPPYKFERYERVRTRIDGLEGVVVSRKRYRGENAYIIKVRALGEYRNLHMAEGLLEPVDNERPDEGAGDAGATQHRYVGRARIKPPGDHKYARGWSIHARTKETPYRDIDIHARFVHEPKEDCVGEIRSVAEKLDIELLEIKYGPDE